MKKLKIGYVPITSDLKSPGDRRRLVFWAKKRGHHIELKDFSNVDLIVLSERSNLSMYITLDTKTPIVFDLVDGYLAAENSVKDFLRGSLKVMSGQLSGPVKNFSRTVADLCTRADLVICSSIEQKELVGKFSKNCHIILDSHEEIPNLAFKNIDYATKENYQLMWEGLPATLAGFQVVYNDLESQFLSKNGRINLVTNTSYHRLLGKYFPGPTQSVTNSIFGKSSNKIEIWPWSIKNLVASSEVSRGGIIPIYANNPIQYLKPENRLLVMWKLGIPTITSSIPSYMRIEAATKLNFTSQTSTDWNLNISALINNKEFAAQQVKLGKQYLLENHTEEILLSKWDDAIKSVV